MDKFIKDLKDFKKKLKKDLPKIEKEVAKSLVDKIKKRMEDGLGVDKEFGEPTPYKKLKKSTIKSRQRNKKLSPLTSPEKSNQIETGRMYKQLKSKKINKEQHIGFFGDRAEVAEYQEEGGRITLNISEEESQDIDKIIDLHVDKIFNESF
jgi:hypothetical protein